MKWALNLLLLASLSQFPAVSGGRAVEHGNLEPIEELTNLTGDTVEFEKKVNDQEMSFDQSRSRSPMTSRSQISTSNLMVIETFLIADYAVYENFLHIAGNNSEKAIENINFHLSHVMLNVDSYYSNMEHSDYKFRIKVKGLRITTKRADSPYTEYARKGNELSIIKSLDKLKKWAKSKKANIPPNDLLLVYSGYTSIDINGVAVLGSVCRQGISLISLGGIPRDSLITAHEIAHNFGAYHDGYKNDCPQENYMMNPEISIGNNLENIYRFSTCTVNSIDAYVRNLTESDENCLRGTSITRANTYMHTSSLASELPGVRFSLDQQCQINLRNESYFCSIGEKKHSKICQKMYCYSDLLPACISNSLTWPADGTSCGDGKWCYNRMCVEDPEAASGKDYCMFGDAKQAFMFEEAFVQCAEGERRMGHRNEMLVKGIDEEMCAHEEIKSMCCETCNVESAMK